MRSGFDKAASSPTHLAGWGQSNTVPGGSSYEVQHMM